MKLSQRFSKLGELKRCCGVRINSPLLEGDGIFGGRLFFANCDWCKMGIFLIFLMFVSNKSQPYELIKSNAQLQQIKQMKSH